MHSWQVIEQLFQLRRERENTEMNEKQRKKQTRTITITVIFHSAQRPRDLT